MYRVFFRTIVLYLLVVFGLRLMGKRQISDCQPHELAVTILLSNIATYPVEEPDLPLVLGAVPIVLFISLDLLIGVASRTSPKLRRLFGGNPMTVVRQGVIDQQAMKTLRLSVDELLQCLRVQGVFDLSEVEWAVMEPTGSISVRQTFASMPPSAETMGYAGQLDAPPKLLVSEGKLLSATYPNGWSKERLEHLLADRGVQLKQVYFLTVQGDRVELVLEEQV